MAPDLGANVFSFFLKKKNSWYCFICLKRKRRKRSKQIKEAWWNVNYIAKTIASQCGAK